MEREIKFRIGFTNHAPIIINWNELLCGEWLANIVAFGEGGSIKYKDQFTGLKDKNGKEIYECDILTNQMQWLGVVIYDPEKCYFNISDDYPDTLYNGDMINVAGDNWMQGEIEVIGNVHENLELLK